MLEPSAVWQTWGLVEAVELVGPDARRFANGMFTNNVRDLAVGLSQRSAMTDDRGRLLGLMDLHALADDRFLLVLDGLTVASFVERYERYVVFDDVEIQPRTLIGSTLQGPGAPDRMRGWIGDQELPHEGQHIQSGDRLIVGRDRGGRGFDVFGEPFAASDHGAQAVLETWRVCAGQLRFAEVTTPALPHEHGLRDAVLHFEKGCYLGQEAIHRLDVQGNPRRSLVGCAFEAAGAAPGPLFTTEGVEVGRLVACVDLQIGSFGLGVVRKPHDEVGIVLVASGAEGRVTTLPFTPV